MAERDLLKERRIEGHHELLIWNVPVELRTKFKMKCLQKGKTMREIVIGLIQDYVKAK